MDVIYKKAGHIELIRLRDGKRFLKTGVVQSIFFSPSLSTANVTDGNSSFGHQFTAGLSGQVRITLSSFQQKLYNALTTLAESEPKVIQTYTLSITGTFPLINALNYGTLRVLEDHGIPAREPYAITISRTPVSPPDILVFGENNEPFTYTEGEPVEGEFKVAGREITFYPGDAGKWVTVAYEATGVDIKRFGIEESAGHDVFSLNVTGEAVLRSDEGVVKIDALTFNRVMPVGEIPPPERRKEPQTWSFTLQGLKPKPGREAVAFTIES